MEGERPASRSGVFPALTWWRRLALLTFLTGGFAGVTARAETVATEIEAVSTEAPTPAEADEMEMDTETDALASPPEGPSSESIVPPRELWFPVGEELIYRVYWGVLSVGEARVWTEWVQDRESDRTLLAIRFRTRSNKVIATIYPVDDWLETLVDPMTFLPVRFEKNMREGRKRYHEITTFNHETLTASWTNLIRQTSREFPIEPDTRDLASFMYYLRGQPFRKGQQSQHRVMADEKIYDLFLRVAAEETVKLDPFGRVPCFRIEPDAKFEGLFVRKGKMTVWVSRDARCISTKITASVPVADVRIELVEVRGPGDDEWIRRSRKR